MVTASERNQLLQFRDQMRPVAPTVADGGASAVKRNSFDWEIDVKQLVFERYKNKVE